MFKSPLFWSDYQPDQPALRKKQPKERAYGWAWKVLAGLLLFTIIVPLILRWAPPPFSAFMMRTQFKGKAYQYHWVSSQRVAPHLAVAVVAAEDQKFPAHWGFDLDAIGKALEENKRRTRARGASTITQQVAKNLFLWPGRSYIRKGLEAYFTVVLEWTWSKKRILEVYLNIAEFGPGVFGAEAASRIYFNKPASQLSPSEAALLAAVLPNPRRLKAANPSDYVKERAWQIQQQMDQLGGSAYLKDVWPNP